MTRRALALAALLGLSQAWAPGRPLRKPQLRAALRRAAPVTKDATNEDDTVILDATPPPLVLPEADDSPLIIETPDLPAALQEPLLKPETPQTRPPPVLEEAEAAARRPVTPPKKEAPKPGDWYTFAFQREAEAETREAAPSYARLLDDDILAYLGVTDDEPEEAAEVVEAAAAEPETSMAAELAGFTAPLLLVWLASPLLSLVDTASVGAFRTTTELAVLGPACAVCDNAAFLCTFLGIVTTGAVAYARVR
eukprot:CAMPEP_0119262426 /NCGR_PEP_ID=MMETSP1329-20130426/2149_1 /TAXON_ID=114041 /ORGANISM="Genus nov. species nov., Strain RCC1024" /LENGTH=251 /DNA_ID=CAMNT_0007262065 /DNA_START=66 /DNA_END=818 /DNA_ORIENTATION=+